MKLELELGLELGLAAWAPVSAPLWAVWAPVCVRVRVRHCGCASGGHGQVLILKVIHRRRTFGRLMPKIRRIKSLMPCGLDFDIGKRRRRISHSVARHNSVTQEEL